VYVNWAMDDRAVWYVRCLLEVRQREPGVGDELDLRSLERNLAATGLVRRPVAALRHGRLRVTLLLRAQDGLAATQAALCVVDVAARPLPDLVVGELLWRAANPCRPPGAGGQPW